MTDFNKIKNYSSRFDEWSRLDSPAGKLEFVRTMAILARYLPEKSHVLDLGGGPGRYTVALAKEGHRLCLADLSPRLLEIARRKIDEQAVAANVVSVDQLDATDPDAYEEGRFDAVLACGPFYHLTDAAQRERTARGISRILKPGGFVFAAFMHRLTGLTGLIDRAAADPDQVSPRVFNETFRTGVFRNQAKQGFQEGYYPYLDEIRGLFEGAGIERLNVVSIKGLAHSIEESLWKTETQSPYLFNQIMLAIEATEAEPAVVAMGGHALFIGKKRINQ